MLLSWLSNQNSMKSNNIKHQILGTLITAKPNSSSEEEAVFGCGCFWGAEKAFWKLPGVKTTAVGYAGGEIPNPTYEKVCSGNTGHTEVVKVLWDKTLIDFSDLLKLFWECHDPTQGNRQGNDRGSQYRSAIYTTTSQQLSLAYSSQKRYQELLTQKGLKAITTEIKKNQDFYYAEVYHQQYLAKPGSRPYCSAMPTQIILDDFQGSNFKLPKSTWENFDWKQKHCVLRMTDSPINC